MIFRLFFAFFKVGLFAIGGGLATLPFLYELSDQTHWFSRSDIADMLAISESTPGALGINMATYAGYKTIGVAGGIVSTLGLIAPSVIIVIIIANFLSKFKESKTVQKALYGLRPASMALIVMAGLNVAQTSVINPEAVSIGGFFLWKAIGLAIALYLIQKKVHLHPVIMIGASALIGILFSF